MVHPVWGWRPTGNPNRSPLNQPGVIHAIIRLCDKGSACCIRCVEQVKQCHCSVHKSPVASHHSCCVIDVFYRILFIHQFIVMSVLNRTNTCQQTVEQMCAAPTVTYAYNGGSIQDGYDHRFLRAKDQWVFTRKGHFMGILGAFYTHSIDIILSQQCVVSYSIVLVLIHNIHSRSTGLMPLPITQIQSAHEVCTLN